MKSPARIYLDNASTSWPKPESVYGAIDDYQRRLGAAVGRNSSFEAREVTGLVAETRLNLAKMIDAEGPERVIFTFNGTDSLNLAIHGILRTGDHVITTIVEHNSVLRPVRWAEETKQVDVSRITCDKLGQIHSDDIRAAIRPNTKLIIVTHASNVTGAIQPIEEIGRIARQAGILFLVDAAQTLGHLPISVKNIGADLLAGSGHKGLLGPLGIGLLYIRPGVERFVNTLRQGGTGSSSSSDLQPVTLPDKYESGNHNALGILGLGAGVQYIAKRGIENIKTHISQLTELLIRRLEVIPGITIYGPHDSGRRTGVVSFTLANYNSPAIADKLCNDYGIDSRAGYHCAGLMHKSLGTQESQGTVRFSVGAFNTYSDILTAAAAVARISETPTNTATTVACPCVTSSKLDMILARPPSLTEQGLLPSSQTLPVLDIAAIPGITELWDETLGDPEIRIAILDGPVDSTHHVFASASLKSLEGSHQNVTSRGRAISHGTHVASVIFAQHKGMLRGIAPKCTGLIRPIYSDGPNGTLQPASQEQLAAAINDAVDAGAHIINISGGEPSPSGEADTSLQKAILDCEKRGILVIAAAGNGDCPGLHSCDCMHVPAALPTVLAVGAMDQEGKPLDFSNCGDGYGKHGLLAPGANVPGAGPGDLIIHSTGTSYATPIVAGIAALVLSYLKKYGRNPNALAVRRILLESVDPCEPGSIVECRRLLAGKLNIHKVMSLLTLGDAAMVTDQEVLPAGCGCQTNASPSPIRDDEEDDQTRRSSKQSADGRSSKYAALSGQANQRQNAMSPSGAPALSVMPSSCIADSNGALVYVIGQLSIDFGTTGNRDSLQLNIRMPNLIPINPIQITDHFGLLAYLLGFKVKYPNPDFYPNSGNKDQKCDEFLYAEVCGNLNDAAYVNWVLLQHNCPKYVVKPQGAYEEAGYLELIRFLIEQNGFLPYLHMPGCSQCPDEIPDDDGNNGEYRNWYTGYAGLALQLRGDCLKQYYCCHGGIDCCPCVTEPSANKPPVKPDPAKPDPTKPDPTKPDPTKPEPPKPSQAQVAAAARTMGVVLNRADYIAIAGELCGTKRLMSGASLPVISPAMRSSSSWNLAVLFKCLGGICPLPGSEEEMFLFAMLQTLGESMLNDGLTPEDRALNYSSTQIIEDLGVLLNPFGPFYHIVSDPDSSAPSGRRLHIGFDGFLVEPAKCRDVDTMPYDVSLIFYNTDSLRPSRVFVTQTVNVADVNPVAQPARVSIRR